MKGGQEEDRGRRGKRENKYHVVSSRFHMSKYKILISASSSCSRQNLTHRSAAFQNLGSSLRQFCSESVLACLSSLLQKNETHMAFAKLQKYAIYAIDTALTI